MVLFPYTYRLFLIAGVLKLLGSSALQTHAFCATGTASPILNAEHQRLSVRDHQDADYENQKRSDLIEIETWFHVVSGEADAELVTDKMVSLQFYSLQKAYEDAAISYRLQKVTRHVNDTWARNGDDFAMKSALRRGGYSTLNVYFQTNLQPSPAWLPPVKSQISDHRGLILNQKPPSVLGFCSLPDPNINASTSRTTYILDGCNVHAKTMPGGPLLYYNRGGTAIHEVGHWNGLLHTFEGESCSSGDPGDYIADTPQQSEPTNGCPSQKDSCPNSPGLDAIHNFMDYSSDECYEAFTPDQARRMRSMWAAVRQGK